MWEKKNNFLIITRTSQEKKCWTKMKGDVMPYCNINTSRFMLNFQVRRNAKTVKNSRLLKTYMFILDQCNEKDKTSKENIHKDKSESRSGRRGLQPGDTSFFLWMRLDLELSQKIFSQAVKTWKVGNWLPRIHRRTTFRFPWGLFWFACFLSNEIRYIPQPLQRKLALKSDDFSSVTTY